MSTLEGKQKNHCMRASATSSYSYTLTINVVSIEFNVLKKCPNVLAYCSLLREEVMHLKQAPKKNMGPTSTGQRAGTVVKERTP